MSLVDQPHLRRLLERDDLDGFVKALEPLCQRLVRRTVAPHQEHEDLLQHARMAAFKAGRDWSPSRGANPLSLATTYIQNELWRVANRDRTEKRAGALAALRLDQPLAEGASMTLGDTIPAADVIADADTRAELHALIATARDLPQSQRRAVSRALLGKPPAKGDKNRLIRACAHLAALRSDITDDTNEYSAAGTATPAPA